MKETLNLIDLSSLWTTGLMMFVAVFVMVVLYALTRTREQAERWSRLPLSADDDLPARDRGERKTHE